MQSLFFYEWFVQYRIKKQNKITNDWIIEYNNYSDVKRYELFKKELTNYIKKYNDIPLKINNFHYVFHEEEFEYITHYSKYTSNEFNEIIKQHFDKFNNINQTNKIIIIVVLFIRLKNSLTDLQRISLR